MERVETNAKEDRQMTKKREILYGASFALIVIGALIIEIFPAMATAMVAVSAICVGIAERVR